MKISDLKELRKQTGDRVGLSICKKALNKGGGDLSAAMIWLRGKGYLEEEKPRRFAAMCPDASPGFGYVSRKALSLSREIDNRPDHGLSAGLLEKVRSGLRQLSESRGDKPEAPLEGVGVEAFYAICELLNLEVVGQSARLQKNAFMDEMVVRNELSLELTVYNLVRSDRKDPEEEL